ncbi:CPS_collapsed_G0049150.mRNA.1.CDS.1 [Saccharomyces cerevisiae]|nr:CPS_collapsed_G0049150.mRNA.1.CDS.1 [Saccharomyces cerevisiae]
MRNSRGIKFPEKLTLSTSPTAMFNSKTPQIIDSLMLKEGQGLPTPEDEEELIRKAIELSLKESRNSASSEPIVPVVESKNEVKRQEIEEEEDPDLKSCYSGKFLERS